MTVGGWGLSWKVLRVQVGLHLRDSMWVGFVMEGATGTGTPP